MWENELNSVDIDESVADINEQIDVLKKQKSLLSRCQKLKLSEEEYHSLCETNLRYTDSLGKMLGKRLGLNYTNKTLAYFEYKLENNWLLCIPNSLVYGVNIYIPNYVRKDFDTDFNIITHKSAMNKAKESLDVINREFFEGNTMDKAKCIYCKKYSHNSIGKCLMLLNYLVSNPYKHYETRFSIIRIDLTNKYNNASNNYKRRLKDLEDRYKIQEELLNKYCTKLFEWTDTIRIYGDKNSTTPICTINKKEFMNERNN